MSSGKTTIIINLCYLYSSYPDDPTMVLHWITLSTSSQIWQLTGKFCRRVSHLLDLAVPMTVSPGYTVVHSHNNLSRCWAEGAHPHVHPGKEKPWVLTSPGLCSCTWVERQQWLWVQVLLCQSDMEAVPPHLASQAAQPDWVELSTGFSSKMKVCSLELSHRMGDDERNRRII